MKKADRSWMKLPRVHPKYKKGVIEFLDKAFARAAVGNRITCPCKECGFLGLYDRQDVYSHLICNGFVEGYTEWNFHGEGLPSMEMRGGMDHNDHDYDDHDGMNATNDIDGLLHDAIGNVAGGCIGEEMQNEEARKFFKLIEEGKQELYPGCKNFSKLSFTIRLYLFKCMNGLTNVAFADLLELLKEAMPEAKLPKSFNEAKSTIKELGLGYNKIHACPNDCILYWKEYENENSCHVCGASRWKLSDESVSSSISKSKIPAKVLRHFPLKPRLQRIFMCFDTAASMTWHEDKRRKDGNLRHPADGQAWLDFDSLHPDFAADPRNVRLGLASDGFNPFRTMSIAHSTWPVVLINYNLPPWMCIKPEYFMLSLLIPGPQSPGIEIDIYLQPLIEELKDLWQYGLETYDAFRKQCFQMRVALLWTVSDFPAYAMLSGWSTKGRLACPSCHYNTCSQYLKHSRKTCYMGHRRFLDVNHPWRYDERSFNGEREERPPPNPLSGTEILEELSEFRNMFGKKKKKKNDCPWKKKSIFFELPYWEYNTCRHNLDVMHIEKNVFDNVIGTLLDIPGKTKDHVKARMDLQDLGIRRELQPIISHDGRRMTFSKACFSMSNEEKDIFCRVLKDVKLPYGCASNISRCVQSKERKISGYKTHDAHIMLQYLLQVAVKKALPKHVAFPLMRLGNFFKAICSKVIKIDDLPRLQSEIVDVLCEFERIFPPAFFDIMMHLPIHLVNEIRLGGPVHYRWMFWLERYLCKLKSYVRNRCRPEGCIAEGYVAEECLTFCSRYMHDGVKTRFNKGKQGSTEIYGGAKTSCDIFPQLGHPIGGKCKRKGKSFTLDQQTLHQAHRYAIFNTDNEDVDNYIREHQNIISRRNKRSRWARANDHSQEFALWFKTKAQNEQVPDHIFWLANGPNPLAKRYSGYSINGYRFHTRARDAKCKTQNSGVTVTASTPSFASSRDRSPILGDVTYYGAINDIIELDYHTHFHVVLFKCDWFEVERDDYGLIRVNFSKLCYMDDPFVLPSQVHQVFYVKDPIEDGCHYVMKRVPRDLFDVNEEASGNVHESFWDEPNDVVFNVGEPSISDGNVSFIRRDLPQSTFDMNINMLATEPNIDEADEDSVFDDTDWEWMVTGD